MRVLVAGAAGFIGSHLTRALLDRGDHVLAVDNCSTGSMANLAEIDSNAPLEVLQADVTKPLTVEGQLDAVLHFASPASPVHYLRAPIATLDAGPIATKALLDLAANHQATFFLASTSEIYGDPLEHPQSEEYWGNVNPIGPRSVYDEAKRCAEAYTMAYHRFGVSTRIVRIFNTYGERMRTDDGRAVPNFIAQALRGENVTIFGDGLQTRSLCYVDDLVRGLLLLLDADVSDPVNLGSSEEVTVLELARAVVEMVGHDVGITFKELPTDDPRRRRPNTARAHALLGWQPRVSLRDGLQRTVDWFRQTTAPD